MPSNDLVLIVMANVFLVTLVLSILLIERSIHVVYDRQGELAFKVYQKPVYGFLVKGYKGYPRKAKFRSFIDSVAYIDKHINGWF